MLDAGADFALGAVRPRLCIRQRTVAVGAPMNTAAKAASLELRLGLGRAMALSANTSADVLACSGARRVAGCRGPRIGHFIAPDQLVPDVRIHVVLYPKKLLPCFFVQRASRSFWQFGRLRSHAAGVWPALRFHSRHGREFIPAEAAGENAVRVASIAPPPISLASCSAISWRRNHHPRALSRRGR
jgi:hypothetical protein